MPEQRKAEDRLWAYSDAVFAVIVTIMVLRLQTPVSHHFASLLDLWPTLVSYVASYVFIASIWINYHYLSRFVEIPSLRRPAERRGGARSSRSRCSVLRFSPQQSSRTSDSPWTAWRSCSTSSQISALAARLQPTSRACPAPAFAAG
jgi:hypothetical protein